MSDHIHNKLSLPLDLYLDHIHPPLQVLSRDINTILSKLETILEEEDRGLIWNTFSLRVGTEDIQGFPAITITLDADTTNTKKEQDEFRSGADSSSEQAQQGE